MITRRRLITAIATTAFAPVSATRTAWAQAWPSRFVRIIVPFPAGSPPDVIGRLLAARLSEQWGQNVVIETKPGAGGNIGAEFVARSTPDGYTLLLTATPFVVNPFLYRSIKYDPIADFAPVTLVSVQPCVMVVPNSSPAHSVVEFIAHAKANQGKITFASAGHGTSPHLAGELFKRMAGIEMLHVPYRSGAPQDLIAGRVDVLFAVAATGISLMRAGKARALGVTGSKRIAAAPELPTIAEAGLPGFDVSPWQGLFAPAKTAPEIVGRIQGDTVAVLAEPGIKESLEKLATTGVGSTSEELSKHLKAEMDKWRLVVRNANITVDG
jgi:tripartite-type tricarboxylate transporter receptor subunit TctC